MRFCMSSAFTCEMAPVAGFSARRSLLPLLRQGLVVFLQYYVEVPLTALRS